MTTKYDVVDNDFFEQGIKACRESSNASASRLPDRYFLFVGRLAPEKNGIGLLDAFKRYRERGGTWDLVLVGRGHLEENLSALSIQLQLGESVHFAGFKNGEELFPYYAFASCFVLPSIREPWGLVVNEAMASGLPVLVSAACGCVPDMLQEGVNGYSFHPGIPEELSELFFKVASLSDAGRSEMGSASKRIIATYAPADWADSASKLVFNSLRNKRSTV